MASACGMMAWMAGALVALAPTLASALERSPVLFPRGLHLQEGGRYVRDLCDPDARMRCHAHELMPAGYRPGSAVHPYAGPPSGAMVPSDVLAAYAIPPASAGNGAIIAIVDLPDTGALTDLSIYRAQFGLPPLSTCTTPNGLPAGTTPCFAAVDQDGNPNPTVQDSDANADAETALDLDMVSAGCPDCSIVLIQMTATGAPNNGDDFTRSVAAAVKLDARATSISFGGSESAAGGDPVTFTTASNLVVAASGDQGYLLQSALLGGGVSPCWPASAPTVLGVGGTNLQSSAGTYTEEVWNDLISLQVGAGSGCSTEYPMPAFQLAYGASKFGATCANKRASADVSAAAQFSVNGQERGIASYAQGAWHAVLGTSAAAPLVAALLVRLGIAPKIAADLGFVYTNAAAFNDVTRGTNDAKGLCMLGDVACTAGPGWDGPTGIGTPNGTKLFALARDGGSDSIDAGSIGAGNDGGQTGDGGEGSGDGGTADLTADGGRLPASVSAPGGCACTSPGQVPSDDAWKVILIATGVLAFGSRMRRRTRT
jgi:hypothetical protein